MKATAYTSAHTEGWVFETGNLSIYILRERVSPAGRGYIITIQEDGMGEGVEIGEVQNISQARPLIRAIQKIQEL